MPNTEEQVSAWQSGRMDVSADDIIEVYFDFIVLLVQKEGTPEQDVEDLVQHVCAKICWHQGFNALSRGDAQGPKRWLRGLVHNAARNQRRYGGRRRAVTPAVEDVDVFEDEAQRSASQLFLRSQTWKRLEEVLGVLEEDQRRAYVLCDLHKLSYAEAAEELEITEDKLRMDLHRARKKLAPLIEKMRKDFRSEYDQRSRS